MRAFAYAGPGGSRRPGERPPSGPAARSCRSGECVEVAPDVPAMAAVRDSKRPAGGPIPRVAPQAWARSVGESGSCPLKGGST
ncbi:DUF397 domain-containing protein [Streptomyces sp. b94]|uniref:DUF397 domain-containing protein n=1 Tax=Streptomyces sp. b94 TaxID=1827634 RepID=UPI001B38994E|nr:DUF397 domain-containing protein [Streptomyces sp. b94]MBQ1098474.1 DUF397 domain-containing protein [Streptomyces sp. b94]